MSLYDIKIEKCAKESKKGSTTTEIWAKITNRMTLKTLHKRIWWQDDDGILHDGIPELPIELRDQVDNAWIETSKKW